MPDFNVMLVEDAGIVASDIAETVNEAGFSLDWKFSSGEECLEELEQSTPDLILMDIELSGEIDGIETTEEIQSKHSIPVVYLTAYSNPDTIDRARETEAFAYFVKPLEKEDLIDLIEWIRSGRTGEPPEIQRGGILNTS